MTSVRTQTLILLPVFMLAACPSLAQEHAQTPQQPATDRAKPAPGTASRVGDPYTLPTCPITGKKLGTMGDPVIKTYEAREIRFCCPACPPKLEKDLASGLATIDKKIIADQSPLYPTKNSLEKSCRPIRMSLCMEIGLSAWVPRARRRAF